MCHTTFMNPFKRIKEEPKMKKKGGLFGGISKKPYLCAAKIENNAGSEALA